MIGTAGTVNPPAREAGPSLAARIAEQARRLEASTDPALRAPALELLQAILELHAAALARMLELSQGGDPAWLLDPVVRSVLLLHELHPHPPERRLRAAIADIEPELARSGARLETHEDAAGMRVRLTAPANGTGDALKERLERALLDAAPDAECTVELFIPSQWIPLEALLHPAGASAGKGGL